jgi:hypothetical protein
MLCTPTLEGTALGLIAKQLQSKEGRGRNGSSISFEFVL